MGHAKNLYRLPRRREYGVRGQCPARTRKRAPRGAYGRSLLLPQRPGRNEYGYAERGRIPIGLVRFRGCDADVQIRRSQDQVPGAGQLMMCEGVMTKVRMG